MKVEIERKPKSVSWVDSRLETSRAAAVAVVTVGLLFALHSPSARAAGEVQADAPPCAMCHGMLGEGSAYGVPRLAGQNADYLSHALSMFKEGTRASAVMQPIAHSLSDTEISQLAGYFSKQNAPLVDAAAPKSSQLVLAGKQLAETGAGKVAACFSCHGAQGTGNGARFPSIAGQPAQFVINRLHQFQARAVGITPQPGTMTAVSTTLNEKQIEEVAAYLSQLER